MKEDTERKRTREEKSDGYGERGRAAAEQSAKEQRAE
jgi:hypothetical protein